MRAWLRKARDEKDLTQQQLGDIVGVDITSIGKYELGERRPSPEVAKKIAQALGFDWTRFYEDKDKETA